MEDKKTAGAVVMTTIILVGFYILVLNNANGTNTDTGGLASGAEQSPRENVVPTLNTSKTIPLTQPGPTVSMRQHKYNNGRYSVQSNFFTPSGNEEFNVTISIEGDAISEVTTTMTSSSDLSRMFQEVRFAPGISGQVVGKDVDDATLIFAVNGASLHSIAFNAALERAKQAAFRSEHNIAYNDA